MSVTNLLVIVICFLSENTGSKHFPFGAVKLKCDQEPQGSACENFLKAPLRRQAAFNEVCVGSKINSQLCETFLQLVAKEDTMRLDIKGCFIINYTPTCHELLKHTVTKELFSLFLNTTQAFNLFTQPSSDNVAFASKYRVTSNCSDELIDKCSEFDHYFFARKHQEKSVILLNEICYRTYTTLHECKFFTQNIVRSAPEALHRFINDICRNVKYVLSSPRTLKICYNLLDVPYRESHLSLSCNKFKYIRNLGEFKYSRDYNKTDLESTAKKALYNFMLRENEQIMGNLLQEQHGLVILLNAACEDSFIFKEDTCEFMWLKVLPNQNDSVILDIMETFCLDKIKDEKEESVNGKPTCKKVIANLCHGKNDTCGLQYAMETMRGSILEMNSTALQSFFDQNCGNGRPNVTILVCAVINKLLPKYEKPLKKLVVSSCQRQQKGPQCRHFLNMTFSLNNNTLKANCFDRFLDIAANNDNDMDMDFYCNTILNGSPGTKIRNTEFQAFKQYISRRRSIVHMTDEQQLFKRWIWQLNGNVESLSPFQMHYAEITYLSFPRGRREAILQHCDYKLSPDCERWVSKLNELGSLAAEYKTLCPDRTYQKEWICENMILACEKVAGSCQPLIDYFIKRSYTPMSCKKYNNMICRYAFNESCLKKLDEYRCYPLLERMGSAKIIDLMPQCELAYQTTSCRMIWERINTSSSVDLLEEVIQGYCEVVEGPNWELKPTLGRACKAIKRMCLWEPILGCFHIQTRWFPIYLHLSPIIFTVSIFGMIKALVTIFLAYLDERQLKREREYQRRDFAAVTFKKYLLPGEVEEDTRLTPHERVRRHLERLSSPEDRRRAAETEKRCKAVMEEVKRRVAERRQQERFDQEDAEMEAEYAN